MGAIAVPILAGKEGAWKEMADELRGARSGEFTEFNERMGLTSHEAYLQQTPQGAMVIAVHTGPGSDEFMGKVAQSDHPFDAWFRGKIEEIHGLDLSQPLPGGMPEKLIG